MKQIDDLIEEERTGMTRPEQHGVGFMGFVTSWQTVARYREYLSIIVRRESDAAANFVKALNTLRKVAPSPVGKPSAKLLSAWEGMDTTRPVIQLEIESFYLFANILLDSIGRAIDKYFRPKRPPMPSLDSHVKLIKHFGDHCRHNKIILPIDFIDKAKTLQRKISKFRNDQITHDERLNRITSMGITHDGRVTMITMSSVMPQEVMEEYPQVSSTHVGELVQLVDEYIMSVIATIMKNRKKRVIDYTV